ncbi:MAG TPA: PIN domain-containing protein [Coleofasciculaceae cyanobacterium]|jgi:tRNA(fMet)-specific endonuclease VapC
MTYLLNTCSLSDYIKGDINTMGRLKQENPYNIFVSSITRFEIEYGLKLKPSLSQKITPQLTAIYQKIKTIDFSIAEANIAAKIRSELKQAGSPIGYYDLLIAATALANNLIVVTSNIKEFSKIENLSVENWR